MNKNFLRLTFILFVICAISTALVVAAYDYTNGIIADRAAANVAEGYKQVLPQAGKLEKLPVPANSPIKEIYRSTKDSKTNGFVYFVLILLLKS